MQTPVQIEFNDVKPTDRLRDVIDGHVNELETRFGRVTGCRVMLKGPSARHKTGGQFEVHVQLKLPDGKQVIVDRTPNADERFSDIDFAINDAFHRARRQLQDAARKMQGQTKMHEDGNIATISQLEPTDDFGMLTTADCREIYFHKNSVLDDSFSKLRIGTRVTFVEESGNKGPQASTVKILGKHGMK